MSPNPIVVPVPVHKVSWSTGYVVRVGGRKLTSGVPVLSFLFIYKRHRVGNIKPQRMNVTISDVNDYRTSSRRR